MAWHYINSLVGLEVHQQNDTNFSLEVICKKEKNLKEKKITELFKDPKALEKEFNLNVKIRLNAKSKNNSFVNNFDNNNGRVNYDGELKRVSRFKYSKIEVRSFSWL